MKTVILSLIGGVLITLLTGLCSNIPTLLVGAVHYGYPLPWLFRLVVASEYFPWSVDLVAFVVDIVIWTTVISLALIVWAKVRTHAAGVEA